MYNITKYHENRKSINSQKKWLDKILDGSKTWEMRTTKTNIRGWIYLIESGTGLIVGKTYLYECSENQINPDNEDLIKYHHVEDKELLRKWKYAWYLKHSERLTNPIPYNHPKGAVIWVNITKKIKVNLQKTFQF